MSAVHSIDDERIAFYYRHRDDIRRWAAIEKDLPQHAHRYLLSLKGRVDDLADALDAELHVLDLDRGHPKLLLVRPHWPGSSEQTRVGIGLEWRSSRVDLVSDRPYVGVWANRRLPEGEQLSSELAEALSSLRGDHGYRSNAWWPAYSYVSPDEGDAFWEDLAPLTEKIVRRARQTWEAFADAVDGVLDRDLK